jgi:hypothetical protein
MTKFFSTTTKIHRWIAYASNGWFSRHNVHGIIKSLPFFTFFISYEFRFFFQQKPIQFRLELRCAQGCAGLVVLEMNQRGMLT